MFDVGFWELTVIAVVALIVIGPEKLPGVARTMGYWIGRARNFAASVQEDIKREVDKSEELKRLMEEQSKVKEMHQIIENTVDEVKKTVSVNAHLPHEAKPMSATPETSLPQNPEPDVKTHPESKTQSKKRDVDDSGKSTGA